MKKKPAMPGRISRAALKSLFTPPATTKYRGGKLTLDERCRGLLRYDPTDCIACGLCMRDCPTGAIRVVNEGTKQERHTRAFLDTGRCIFCGQCVDSCAKNCLSTTSAADLADFTRDGLTKEL